MRCQRVRLERWTKRILDAAKRAEETAVVVVLGGGLDRPVDHHRAAHDGAAIDKAPVAAVPAAVAIVAHDEVMIGRDDKLAVAGREFMICSAHSGRKPHLRESSIGGGKLSPKGSSAAGSWTT